GEEVSKKEKKRWHDNFIEKLLNQGEDKIEFFGQWEIRKGEYFYYFISHSAMREWEYQQIDIHQVFP
ncbi:hypothetical protein, partial [Aggregatibacter actinomycetemcomitans]|uniref:hypothetical protein n=1 Tax=Aggregatibacter actinomycetemcomitans TaxID=714 RepID=UPI001F11F113